MMMRTDAEQAMPSDRLSASLDGGKPGLMPTPKQNNHDFIRKLDEGAGGRMIKFVWFRKTSFVR